MYINSLNYIWNIEIVGNSKISTTEILELISADELVGKKKKAVDCTDIEYKLREEYNQMGWVSVFVDHTNLCIYIKESLYDEYVFEEQDTIARYDYIAGSGSLLSSHGRGIGPQDTLKDSQGLSRVAAGIPGFP